jgi:hypothetical protein
MQFLMVTVLDGSAKLPMLMNSVLLVAGADCFGVSLVTASRGKFAHLENATTGANRSPAIAELATLSRLCTADAVQSRSGVEQMAA